MKNSSYVRSALALAALEFVPPLIRSTLFEEQDFCEEYGLKAEPSLSFGGSDIFVQSSNLYEAVRKILSGAAVEEVADTNGQKWKLKDISEEGELPKFEMSWEKQGFLLEDLAVLSPDKSLRLRCLTEIASDINLPDSVCDSWRNILEKRALENGEVVKFQTELSNSPIKKESYIRDELLDEKINIPTLVPYSRKYFERLVGVYNGNTSIRDYATSIGRKLFSQFSLWRPYDGFLRSLLLSSHSSMTDEVSIDKLEKEELVTAFDFLNKNGDRISQLGAIEIGLRILPLYPQIESYLIRLVKQIRDDDVEGQKSGFKLLSTLFVLVEDELSRTRLLSGAPPFYRRLAALSQAALIQRQFINSPIDIDRFHAWVFANRAELYYMQALVDMRMEPRWNPDFVDAAQMKADFIGRMMIAARKHEQNIRNSVLHDIIFKNELGNLYSARDLLQSFLPGPLEGAAELQNIEVPDEISTIIETQLGTEEAEPSSFFALVNSALIYRISADHAGLAAKVLKQYHYRLANIADRMQLFTTLKGLALVAAVTRSSELADQLRVLLRRYQRDAQYTLSIMEVVTIHLTAAASHMDLDEWREYVGECMTELAFSDLKGDEGKILYSILQYLFHLVPELWVSCGRAEAALMAYNAS